VRLVSSEFFVIKATIAHVIGATNGENEKTVRATTSLFGLTVFAFLADFAFLSDFGTTLDRFSTPLTSVETSSRHYQFFTENHVFESKKFDVFARLVCWMRSMIVFAVSCVW